MAITLMYTQEIAIEFIVKPALEYPLTVWDPHK